MSELVQPDHWVAVTDRLPPEDETVLILIADSSVAIYARPTCAYLRTDYQGTDRERSTWWAGVPGNWMRLPANGWVVTHWTPLPTWRDGHWMTRGSCLGTEVPRV